MEQTTLYYRAGGSDKVYRTSIEPKDGGYVVTIEYGRRGSTLQTGIKTPTAVSYDAAKGIYDKLIKEKKAKGYTPGEHGTPYQHTELAGSDTGIRPQLLNPIEEDQVPALLRNPQYWCQEKYDGKRLLIQKKGNELIGINRRGLQVTLPVPWIDSAKICAVDFALDGESVGEVFFAFDLLMIEGEDMREKTYVDRYLRLMNLLFSFQQHHIKLPETACTDVEKQRMLKELKTNGKEGIVFKRIDQPYTEGRPSSAGPALKFKFCETASFVVAQVNGKRSVSLSLFDGKITVAAGNVTIPPNQPIPIVGAVVEVRYLYAFKESGAIYQPVYLGVRDDITKEECTVDQLKYKAQEVAA
jgi:bifunctional non-homologous end joining protein LigD